MPLTPLQQKIARALAAALVREVRAEAGARQLPATAAAPAKPRAEACQ